MSSVEALISSERRKCPYVIVSKKWTASKMTYFLGLRL